MDFPRFIALIHLIVPTGQESHTERSGMFVLRTDDDRMVKVLALWNPHGRFVSWKSVVEVPQRVRLAHTCS